MNPLVSILFLTIAPPQITSVVVYPDRAQVTRAQTVACGPRALATFSAIPPSADPSSLRAKTSVGTIEGLRSELRTRAESFAPEVTALESRIRRLEGLVASERDASRRAAAQGEIAGGFTEVAVGLVQREMSSPAPSVKSWSRAFETALKARERASADAVSAAARIRDLSSQLDELRRKREGLSHAALRRELEADVLVACPAGRSATIELSYLVGGASWQPAYEARADEGAGAVELATLATVRQSTGESWSQVRVTLSTAVPRQDATPPSLSPLNVWAEPRRPEKKVLVRREELHEHGETSAASGAIIVPTEGHMHAAPQGLSVQLTVPELADIAGDDTPSRLLVERTRLAARFALRTMPTMLPFAFRVADLENRAPFPLLPGPLDAFRRGGLIARYSIDRVAEGEPFHLTFGVEESVRVKRVIVEEVARDAGFFGTTRRFRYGYRFELANYLTRAEVVELSDHIPVSELDDVKVVLDPKSTAGYQTQDSDGIVTWRVTLRPGEKRRIDLAFHVDVPASYDAGNL